MITSPSLASQVWRQRSNTMSSQEFLIFVMDRFFGQGKQFRNALRDTKFLKEMHTGLNLLQKEPQLTDLIRVTKREVELELPNLSTFLPGEIDQPEWERSANSVLVAAGVVEVDIFPLLRNFVGNVATKVLMGEGLLKNHPNLLNDIWTLDSRMNDFYMGMPFFMPHMSGPYAARFRILRALTDWSHNYQKVLKGEDADYMWGEMSDVSDIMKVREKMFVDYGLKPSQCAAAELSVLWVMNVNANSIIYWLLMHILADPVLLTKILKETSPYIKITYSNPDDPDFIAPEPPRLRIDLESLLTKCPLLNSAYWETLRIDSYAWGYSELLADITLTSDPDNTNPTQKQQTYTLRKGEYVAIPTGAHHTDPRAFPDPQKWIPDRFLSEDAPQIRPFGGGTTMCKGRLFAEREVLMIVAALVNMYDFEAAPGHAGGVGSIDGRGGIKVPRHASETHSGTYAPENGGGRVRVRVRGI